MENQFLAGTESAPVEEIEIIPEQGSSPVDLSAEFAELNDAAPVMQEGKMLLISPHLTLPHRRSEKNDGPRRSF